MRAIQQLAEKENKPQPKIDNLAVVILAAGKGTRMRSELPKVLHPLLHEPMIAHILRALAQTGIPPEQTVIVVGYGAEQVRAAVQPRGAYRFVEQGEQLGTGHAVKVAAGALREMQQTAPGVAEHTLVLLGDGPLLQPQTLQTLIEHHFQHQPLLTMATTTLADPTGYGRIIRAADGRFQAIIEQLELTPDQIPIQEINPSLYLFRTDWLLDALPRLQPSRVKGEYYLTDLPAFAVEQRATVETVSVPAEEVLGINDRVQLAEANAILRQRILRKWMLAGVTITDPASTFIGAEVKIGADSVIEPNTHLRGTTEIGANCVIGPNSILESAKIADNCQILASMIEFSTLEESVTVGPFSHIRPNSYLEHDVHLGNFAEVNRSRLGAHTRQGHFSYIGDATLGEDVNIGAGTITANFDGVNKNKTVIGHHVKLGSDTTLVAPVTVGDEAVTGAGAVVTKDVAKGATVVGVPAKPKPSKIGE